MEEVFNAVQLCGSAVAANPQDRWVVVIGNRIIVITDDGRVFAHEITGNSIGTPFQLSGPAVAANSQDRWVVVMGIRIIVITDNGRVFAHEIQAIALELPFSYPVLRLQQIPRIDGLW